MSKNKKSKPTNQDFVNVINTLIQDINILRNDMDAMMRAFDMYIKFKKEEKKFKAHIDDFMKAKQDELQATGQDNRVADTADSTN